MSKAESFLIGVMALPSCRSAAGRPEAGQHLKSGATGPSSHQALGKGASSSCRSSRRAHTEPCIPTSPAATIPYRRPPATTPTSTTAPRLERPHRRYVRLITPVFAVLLALTVSPARASSVQATVPDTIGPIPPSPDLVVDAPSVTDNSPAAGASFALSVTVRNQGDGVSRSTALRYYRSNDASISTSDTEVGTDQVNGLSASETSEQSIDLTAPSSAGTYYYGACVDMVWAEFDPGNDCSSSVMVTVSPDTASPDTVSTASAPGAPTTGLTVTWSAPSSKGGSAITAYDLRYIRSDAPDKADANWTVVEDVWSTGSGALLTYELTGLSGGTRYDVQVRAVNGSGDGPWSATATGTTEPETDFDGDGKTGLVDFVLFSEAYGGTDARFDLDGSGKVDFVDFFDFIDAFDL